MAANSSHSPSLENEKLPVDAQQDQPKPRGFFSRKPKQPEDADDEKRQSTALDGAAVPAAHKITPVSFSELFRCVILRLAICASPRSSAPSPP